MDSAHPKTPSASSPTLTPNGRQLKELTREDDQMFAVPSRPAGKRPMSPGEHSAAESFRANIEAADPNRNLRRDGEFFQTFRMEDGRAVPNIPVHYERGGGIGNPPPGSLPPGTSHVIHSHPKDGLSDRPSSDDYYEAWKTKKTAGAPKEMMFDIGRDRFYGYEGSYPPSFERLKPPGSPDTPPRTPGSASSSSSSGSEGFPDSPGSL